MSTSKPVNYELFRAMILLEMLQLLLRLAKKVYQCITSWDTEPKEWKHPLGLPPEIWHRIVDLYLPYESRCVLALTCKSMARILGTDSWAQLDHLKDTKLAFLKLLGDSFPNHWLCHGCLKYRARIVRHEQRGYRYPCDWPCQRANGCAWLVPRLLAALHFSDIQLAVRAHRLGKKFGSIIPPFERLHWYCVSPGCSYWLDTTIFDGRLLMKLRSAKNMTDIAGYDERYISDCLGSCPHYITVITELCRCVMSHMDEDPDGPTQCTKCLALRRCTTCASEYLLRGERVSRRGCLLTLYRWSDLGDGIDPTSREWAAAARLYPAPFSTMEVFDLTGLQSVRTRFESTKGEWVPDEQPQVFPNSLFLKHRFRILPSRFIPPRLR